MSNILKSNSQTHGIVCVMLAATLWSFGGIWIKLMDWPPMAIAGARAAFALPCLAMFALFQSNFWKRNASVTGKKKFVFNIKALFWSHVLCILALSCNVISFVLATKWTTAANAVLLQFTAPIYVLLLSPFILKERNQIYDFIVLGLSLLGLVCLLSSELLGTNLNTSVSSYHVWGLLLACLSGLSSAVMTIFLRQSSKQANNPISPIHLVLLANTLTALICCPWLLKVDVFFGPSLKYAVLLGLFQVALAYVFYTQGLKYIKAQQGALFQIFEPLLNPVWVMLFYQESPSFVVIVGGGLILASVVLKYVLDSRNC